MARVTQLLSIHLQVVQAYREEGAFAQFAEWVREPDLDAIREAQAAGKRKPGRKRKAAGASSDEASDAGASCLRLAEKNTCAGFVRVRCCAGLLLCV